MNPAGIAAQLERATRGIVPAATVLLLVLVSMLPLPVAGLSNVMPAFGLMAVYYWVVLRPDLLPRTVVFGLGLVTDALSGLPFGIHALVYLLVHAAMLDQRRFIAGRPFWLFWGGFVLVATAATAGTWLLASLLRGAILAPTATLVTTLLTIAIFPLATFLLLRVQRGLVGADVR
ncbi:MAG: rod shape-determining protein MreD [Alphaproteobacteria bacterium]|nr:rod shape-determining protein MreD [Alphaproteobacteria bacterium]